MARTRRWRTRGASPEAGSGERARALGSLTARRHAEVRVNGGMPLAFNPLSRGLSPCFNDRGTLAAPLPREGASMKHLFTSLALCAAAFALPVHATSHKEAPDMAKDKAPTAQQSKMTTCNKDAGDKKGDERKAFMKTCLSAKPAAAAPVTQQDKMKTCNKDASGKKGDERKAFMKSCLSAPA
jgi:hypothetical protein